MKKILVLGGSQFMGKSLLEFISQDRNYEVHYINRNKYYWNNEVKNIQNLHFTFGDRDDSKDFILLLKYLSDKLEITEDSPWHCIIDFTGYSPKDIYPLTFLQNKSIFIQIKNNVLVRLYIFISTNSVYDNCVSINIKNREILEEEAIRPESKKEQERLNRDESYGHKKLQCEELLSQLQQTDRRIPYIILRLPDVIGPYDSTHRYWIYYKWIRELPDIPIQINKFDQPFSLVYSKDVVNLIQSLIQKEDLNNILYQAYNIGFDQSFTLEQFLKLMCKNAGIQKDFVKLQQAKTFLSSVESGPGSIDKAKKLLNFVPKNIEVAIKETDQFFKQAYKYQKESIEVEQKITKKVKIL